jgi:hypothetical protein
MGAFSLEFPEFSAAVSLFPALLSYPVSQVSIIITPHFFVRNSGRFRCCYAKRLDIIYYYKFLSQKIRKLQLSLLLTLPFF